MTSTNELYDNLEKMGVDVFYCPLSTFKALASPEGCVGIDYTKVDGEAEERAILIHEEGHFATGAFYQMETPFVDRKHQENIASRYGYKKYFPIEMVLDAMNEGFVEPWDLAEYFGVPETYINEMIAYYGDACGINFADARNLRRQQLRAEEATPISAETLSKFNGIALSIDPASLCEEDAQTILKMLDEMRKHRNI